MNFIFFYYLSLLCKNYILLDNLYLFLKIRIFSEARNLLLRKLELFIEYVKSWRWGRKRKTVVGRHCPRVEPEIAIVAEEFVESRTLVFLLYSDPWLAMLECSIRSIRLGSRKHGDNWSLENFLPVCARFLKGSCQLFSPRLIRAKGKWD